MKRKYCWRIGFPFLFLTACASGSPHLPIADPQTATRSLCWEEFPDVPRKTAEQVRLCEIEAEVKFTAVDEGTYWFVEPKSEYRGEKWVTYKIDKMSGLPIEVKLIAK